MGLQDEAEIYLNRLDEKDAPSILDHDAIRRIREARKMSQDDLARAIGQNSSNISRLESGKYPHTTTTTVSLLAQALMVHVTDLIIAHPGDQPEKSLPKLDLQTIRFLTGNELAFFTMGNLKMKIPDHMVPEIIARIRQYQEREVNREEE